MVDGGLMSMKKTNKIMIPEFKNDDEIRDYLIAITLELVVNLKENALKKGNVRKAPIVNAKNGQYRVALESIKILNSILKDKEINVLAEKLKNLEKFGVMGIDEDNKNEFFEMSPEVKKELEKLELLHMEC